jgi:WS/DGAT/MGAT family acyltransferase
MEQLSGLDATFLYMETSTNYGHVGGMQVFRQPEVPHFRTPEEDAAHTEYLYSKATYTRRRLVEVPFGLDHPYWIEDPNFDREFHERFHAVPSPGTDRQLADVVSRIASRPLDRSRPLWEVYLIEGVDRGRKFAVYSKTHHCAIDGASGTQLALETMQLTPEPVNYPMPDKRWRPEAIPTQAEMLTRGLVATARRPMKLVGVQRRMLTQTLQGLRGGAGGPPIRDRVPAMLHQLRMAPRTIFNGSIGQHRRFAFGSTSLSEAREIKAAFDCTVNDVVLAECAGMLRAWLGARDELPAQSLVAMVPVSVRTEEHAGSLGNQVSSIAAVLHTDEPDPVTRLRKINESMTDSKIVQAALPIHAQLELVSQLPAAAMEQAMRLAFQTRLSERLMPFNLCISNVPGPQMPLYLDGAEQLASYPYSTITDGMALNITVCSYNGHMDWGIVVDRDLVHDPWPMFDGIVEAHEELLERARAKTGVTTARQRQPAKRRSPAKRPTAKRSPAKRSPAKRSTAARAAS